MRGLLFLVGGGVLVISASLWYMLPAPIASAPPPAADPVSTPAVKPNGKPKTATSEAARARQREVARLQASLPMSSTVVNVDMSPDMTIRISTPPAPTPQDLRPGMARGEIVQAYGPPSLSTTQSNHGILMERYFYQDRTRGKTTMALMENGRVVSAADWAR
jgi:hypothetical protein